MLAAEESCDIPGAERTRARTSVTSEGYSHSRLLLLPETPHESRERARKKHHILSPLTLLSLASGSYEPNVIRGHGRRGPGDAV